MEPSDESGSPVLIADDVRVTYHLHGGRKRAVSNHRPTLAQRILRAGAASVGGRSSLIAVDGVSLVANHGERIGLIGRNGAGKSTLLRALAGLLPLSDGTVYAEGTTALMGVNAALSNALTGAQNVMIGGLALGLTRAQVNERFDDIVDFAGIRDHIDMPMRSYSSGMAARLRFAISTAVIPDILMIDEALATGDAAFRKRSMAKMEEVRHHAGTVFLVSHNSNTIESFCDRAIWLEAGQIVADGPASDVVADYRDAVE